MKISSYKEKLSGVFVPTITPFKDDKIQYDHLKENILKLNSTSVKGYFALGSNGEYKSLSLEEYFKVLEIFVNNKGSKTLIASAGFESTRETIKISKTVSSLGFDFISVITPSYFAKNINDEILVNYYKDIAENIDIPLLLYNAPSYAGGVKISSNAVQILAQHENIVGLKDSSSSDLLKFLAYTSDNENFFVLSGSANTFLNGLIFDAVGGILSLANVIPDTCCKLYEYFQNDNLSEAKILQFKILKLNSQISGKYGVSGVKAAATIKGFYGGEPRKPLKSLSQEQKNDLRKYLDTFSNI